ncbi:MAG: nucleotidyltransferase family protein [Candidatus Kuenenia sp.]|nr:nucleotidyltransferase family protein [Candidatus Kuenenia hertensis]
MKNQTTPLGLLNLYLNDNTTASPQNNMIYQKFNEELTWHSLLKEGYQVDVAPFLYYIIKKESSKYKGIEINIETKKALEAKYNEQLVNNLIQFNELKQILNAFEEQGIDVILLKGSDLAKSYYPDQALRPMCDVDVLIQREHMARAKELLICQGYISICDSPLFDHSVDEEYYEKEHFHFPYIKQLKNVYSVIELHQNIATKKCRINNKIKDFFSNSYPINNKQNHILRLKGEYLLLHIFWHTYLNFSKNLFVRFIWLLDIILIIKSYNNKIDWNLIEKKSCELGIQRQVFFCLYLTTQLFGIPAGKNLTGIMPSTHFPLRWFNYIVLNTTHNNQSLKGPNRIFIILLNILSTNLILEKAKYITGYYIKNLLRRPEWLRQRYGINSNVLIYFIYFVHPITIIIEFFQWVYKYFWKYQNKHKT